MRIESRWLTLIQAIENLDVPTALPLLDDFPRNIKSEKGWSLIQVVVNHLNGMGVDAELLLTELLNRQYDCSSTMAGGGCPIMLCVLNRHFNLLKVFASHEFSKAQVQSSFESLLGWFEHYPGDDEGDERQREVWFNDLKIFLDLFADCPKKEVALIRQLQGRWFHPRVTEKITEWYPFLKHHAQYLPGHVLMDRYRRNLRLVWEKCPHEWLIKRDAQGRTMLHQFVFDPDEEHTIFSAHPKSQGVRCLEEGLKHGLLINAVDHEGYTALGYACLYMANFPEFIQWLLDQGADPYHLGPKVPMLPLVTAHALNKQWAPVAVESRKKRL